MTVFNDIMLAEQEAEQEILSAKEESVTLVAAARTAHLNALQTEEAAFAVKAESARKEQIEKIENTVNAIRNETETTATAVSQQYEAKHKEVLATLVSRFQ